MSETGRDPLGKLTVVASAALVASFLSGLGLAMAHFGTAAAFHVLNHGMVTVGSFQRTNDLQLVAATLDIATHVIVGMVFIVWMRRCYGALESAGEQLPYTAGWTIGAWLVPFISLWRPKRLIDAMWQASDPAHARSGPGVGFRPVAGIVDLWWVLYIVGAVGVACVATVLRLGETSEVTIHQVVGIFCVLNAGAAIVAATMVRRLGARVRHRVSATPSYVSLGSA
jgi:hypothetical protein